MKFSGSQYLDNLDPERFLYLKSIFVIKNVDILDIPATNNQFFKGDFEGISIYSDSFIKGKYTL